MILARFQSGLPIDAALPELQSALSSQLSAVLVAPPGAGKSTVVPLALLDATWARGKRILMLEPRRLAARAVAARMARTLGESVGGTVGYRMRLDTRVSRETRIEVVTEGVLTRMLQSDPALEGTAAVLFDEFHERSLQADLGLALVCDARAMLGLDTRILIMSATIEAERVARLLDGAAVIAVAGRTFPVATRFCGAGLPVLPPAGRGGPDSPERRVTQLVLRALREESGDVLVFLPGAPEIRRVQAALAAGDAASHARILPLYGELGSAEQDAALSPADVRKVVLATNIAETSLTIEGVRIVVDSGLVRRAVFDPATGMSRLTTARISRASAEQRQGRAGRLGPGVCYRAWSEGAHQTLAAFTTPEILESDLVPLALDLAAWGVEDASALRWLDPPAEAQLASARELLRRLDALGEDGRITAHGREMQRLGVHPRLSHMALRARDLNLVSLAAELAALLSERDLLRAASASDADLRTRLEALRGEHGAASVDRGAAERTRRVARELARQLGADLRDGRREDVGSAGILLCLAYPDRIARRRAGGDGRFLLANGRGAQFHGPQTLAREEFLVAVDLDDADRDARIRLAAPVARADIDRVFADRIRHERSVRWDSRSQAVSALATVRLDALVLESQPLLDLPADAAREAMLEGIAQLGLEALPWDAESRELRARVKFMARLEPAQWPDWADESLSQSLGAWLAPWLDGITRHEQLVRVPLAQTLRGLLDFGKQRRLDELAPTHLVVPSGSRVRIDYHDESAPAVSVRLQEVFGLAATPRIGGGRVPITFKLLSPAQRPVQVTRDLASFWQGSYHEVRKDLRGRYPKHYWPEDPLQAQAVRGTRRKISAPEK